MNMAQESSVLISLQQLLDEEQARQTAEQVEQRARLAREREAHQMKVAADAARAEQAAARAREEEVRLDAIRQAELMKARLAAEVELENVRLQAAAERVSVLASNELTAVTARRQAKLRMSVAALATLLGGAIAIWACVIVPGQRRSNQAYLRLQDQYTRLAEQAAQRESTLARRVQGLGEELKRAHLELAAAAVPSAQKVALPIFRPTVTAGSTPSRTRKTACTCLASDPLCDCLK